MMQHNIRNKVESPKVNIATSIFDSLAIYRPRLFNLLSTFGDLRLSTFTNKLFANAKPASLELANSIARSVERLFGSNVAAEVRLQLLNNGTVATGDHHGICSHPILFQGDLLAAAGASTNDLKYLIILATGNVPLNNATYPRGVIDKAKRYPLFSDSSKHALVYAQPKFDLNRTSTLPPGFRELIGSIPNLDRCEYFSDQITLINHQLFAQSLPLGSPQVLTLQLEDVVSDLLAKGAQATFLLQADQLQDVLATFQDIPGAWSADGGGSHLFWGRDQKGRAERLNLQNNSVSTDGFSLKLSTDSIVNALENKRVLPGLLLSFAILLQNSATCLGGFNQIDYLSSIKTQLLGLADRRGYDDLAVAIEDVATDRFSTGPLFLFDRNDDIVSIEDLLRAGTLEYMKFNDLLGEVSLRDAALVGLREMYSVFVPAAARSEQVLNCGTADLARQLGVIK